MQPTNGRLSLSRMAKPHARTITDADLQAAARLKAIWLAIPKDRRPTQQLLAEHWDAGGEANQSLISQYMTGKIALNYRAVLFFARELGCTPDDIRDDLHEQRFSQGSFATPLIARELAAASQSLQLDIETIRDAHELIRGSYEDDGKVYDIEAEPDLFATVYAKLLLIKGQKTLANVAPIVRDIDRLRAEGENHGTRGRDERVGGAAKAPGKKRASS